MKKHKLTLQDLNSIAEFNVIVMNYMKMVRLLNKAPQQTITPSQYKLSTDI